MILSRSNAFFGEMRFRSLSLFLCVPFGEFERSDFGFIDFFGFEDEANKGGFEVDEEEEGVDGDEKLA